MDFVRSEPGDDPIVVEAYFAAPPETLYRAWTDPDIVMKWFGPAPNTLHSASIDLRPGGTWRFLKSGEAEKTSGFEGEYVEIEPGLRLVFTWIQIFDDPNGKRQSGPASRVEVSFTSRGKGTNVRVVHSAVHDEDTRNGFSRGWNTAFNTMTGLFLNPSQES